MSRQTVVGTAELLNPAYAKLADIIKINNY
jgi:hypothetical protein